MFMQIRRILYDSTSFNIDFIIIYFVVKIDIN
jgi:hypothetical protein